MLAEHFLSPSYCCHYHINYTVFKYLKTKSHVIVAVQNDNVHYSVCFAFYLCCLVFRQNRCIGQGSFQCFCIFLPRLILRTNVTIFLTKIKGELLNNGTSLIKTPKRQKCSICIRKVSIVQSQRFPCILILVSTGKSKLYPYCTQPSHHTLY